MAKVAGSVWVDGITLHYIDKNGNEWYFTGTAGSTPAGAIVGSIWVESADETIHYIDNAGVNRSVHAEVGANRSGVGAVPGSIWVDSVAAVNFSLHAIDSIQVEQASHTDVHNDVAASHADTHGDIASSHTDIPAGHSDSHGDIICHGDAPHSDYHFDGHLDDSLNPPPFFDGPHHDAGLYTDHSDAPHGDTLTCGVHGDFHEDGPGSDGVNGFPGGAGYSPLAGHDDSHADWNSGSHTDSHNDATVGHSDTTTPHTDTHTDTTVGHVDTHFDQPTAL